MSESTTKHLFVSIVICTYNRSDFLANCLQALCEQSKVSDEYEIIVIDNNSNDDTKKIVQIFMKDNARVRYVFEPVQGISSARNRGWKEASGSFVAYLDDDGRAFPDYIERLFYGIKTFDFDCWGGVFKPWFYCSVPHWFLVEYGSSSYRGDKIKVLPGRICNYAGIIVFKKEVFQKVGGFNLALGMYQGQISYGEEDDLQLRIKRAGGKVGFDPGLCMYHAVHRYKMRLRWFFREAYAKGRVSWIVSNISPTWTSCVKQPFAGLYHAFKQLIIGLSKALDGSYYIQNIIIDIARPIYWSLGRIAVGSKMIVENRKRIPLDS